MFINICVMVYSSCKKLRLYIQLYRNKYNRWKASREKAKPEQAAPVP